MHQRSICVLSYIRVGYSVSLHLPVAKVKRVVWSSPPAQTLQDENQINFTEDNQIFLILRPEFFKKPYASSSLCEKETTWQNKQCPQQYLNVMFRGTFPLITPLDGVSSLIWISEEQGRHAPTRQLSIV